MNSHSATHVQPNGARVEVGTVTHEGRSFEALGSIVDEASGLVVGYVSGGDVTGWNLTTWEGAIIAPLKLRGTWKQGGFGGVRNTIRAWSAVINGRTYSGRNGGWDLLRLRASA